MIPTHRVPIVFPKGPHRDRQQAASAPSPVIARGSAGGSGVPRAGIKVRAPRPSGRSVGQGQGGTLRDRVRVTKSPSLTAAMSRYGYPGDRALAPAALCLAGLAVLAVLDITAAATLDLLGDIVTYDK